MKTTARRTQALSTVHALSVCAVSLVGVGLLATRAAESTETPAANWSMDRPGINCVATHPVNLAPNGGAPWRVHDRDQTFTVTDGRTVMQSRHGGVVLLDAGDSHTVPAFDLHRYDAVGDGPASMRVDSACTSADRPTPVAAESGQG